MIQFGHVELFVRDPVASQRFYVDVLGFELVAVQGPFVWVKAGAMELLLRPANGDPPASSPAYRQAHAALVLYTDDLEATRTALVERGLVFRGDDGGPDCPTFTDPDGHWFQLADPSHG